MFWIFFLTSGLLISQEVQANDTQIDFGEQIRPIFAKHCFSCHGGIKQSGGLNLIVKESLFGESDSGKVLQPGKPYESELIDRVSSTDADIRMPPPEHGRALSSAEVEILTDWIAQGAEWKAPWALTPVKDRTPPEVDSNWPRTPIDQFILARQQSHSLQPNEEASPSEWLRRVSFDLIGLPPRPELLTRIHNTPSESTYVEVVDELLASPHFGERWASVWLDLARYADTSGYEKDVHRDMWPYRDWVIRSLNDDLPYTEFLKYQLAGDLISNRTIDSQLATAFHRNTQTNHEGGTDDEEFRIAAVIDRVDTTWQALQGITMACAKCHDHPFDPITQEDYYRFAGFFNSTQDCDLDEDWPRLKVPLDRNEYALAVKLDKEVESVDSKLHALSTKQVIKEGNQWHGLSILEAKSTGETELSTNEISTSINGSVDHGDEILAGGTVTDRSFYKIKAKPRTGAFTALRIDALPKSIDEALKNPELGFVLSRLRAFLVRADGTEQEIFFSDAISDEASPWMRPEEALTDSPDGWSAYSRIFRPRWAVFIVDQQMDGAIQIAEGDQLRITLKHDKALDGQGALVIRRLRMATSSDESWSDFANDPTRHRLLLLRHELINKRKQIKSVAIPVMAEREYPHRRPNYLFERGNFLVKGKKLPAAMPQQNRNDFQSSNSRLDLANWTSSTENPLTARVWVNRIWSQLFGQGIVTTLDDFGAMGEKPSHPELLDHLAHQFMTDKQWRLKPLLREIVLSSTYRQSSKTDESMIAKDPSNQWLARGPRRRLSAEMIRDQALTLSGKFNDKLYGPPVMPYQPKGIWRSVYNDREWNNATDKDRFRRAIYTYWKRTAPYPSSIAFDLPSREVCTAERNQTNTPLQAFVTLNDPAYIELAEGFTLRIASRESKDLNAKLHWAYQEATTQKASPSDIQSLRKLYKTIIDQTEDQSTAMRMVALTLMNLDASLTR